MHKITNIGCSILLALIVGFVIIAGVLSWANTPATAYPAKNRTSSNNVILRAAPGNAKVQMFDELTEDPDVKVTTFPDGWGCRKLSERIAYDDGYGTMYFYKLDCGNKTGYVNAQWVR